MVKLECAAVSRISESSNFWLESVNAINGNLLLKCVFFRRDDARQKIDCWKVFFLKYCYVRICRNITHAASSDRSNIESFIGNRIWE
jgi:hypothetical protein